MINGLARTGRFSGGNSVSGAARWGGDTEVFRCSAESSLPPGNSAPPTDGTKEGSHKEALPH